MATATPTTGNQIRKQPPRWLADTDLSGLSDGDLDILSIERERRKQVFGSSCESCKTFGAPCSYTWDCISCQVGRDNKAGPRGASFKKRDACAYHVVGSGKQTRTLATSDDVEEFYRSRSTQLWQDYHRRWKIGATKVDCEGHTRRRVEEEQRRSHLYLSKLSNENRRRRSTSDSLPIGGSHRWGTQSGISATSHGRGQQPAQVMGTVPHRHSHSSSATADCTNQTSATGQLLGASDVAFVSPESAYPPPSKNDSRQSTESSMHAAGSMTPQQPQNSDDTSYYNETQVITIAALKAMRYQGVADEASQ